MVKGLADRVLGGQGVGLEGPRGSRGRPTGSQAVGFMSIFCQDFMLSEKNMVFMP